MCVFHWFLWCSEGSCWEILGKGPQVFFFLCFWNQNAVPLIFYFCFKGVSALSNLFGVQKRTPGVQHGLICYVSVSSIFAFFFLLKKPDTMCYENYSISSC